ncbi:DNA cytosine methyltransferase [Paenibacillus qinlingensis]|uniref:DNA cytosine methyltransferase n=1 Tax=Paenibacillus qinlingensis TaxID=1837343 RepID=UPI001563C976|nr:DNA cytosine methyltransferase [Paenibacillus qinlingensis]NQX62901.1 DNA cytosine methyltransferase [Paenibacillus qinlingensis]
MEISIKKPIAIDLFSGAGGLTLGFEMAGFSVNAAVEMDEFAIKAHLKNFPHCEVVDEDINQVSGEDLLKILKVNQGEVDVIIGGPPCQGFSLAGKRSLDDVRNELLSQYARIVLEVMPKFFVMENVKGLLSYKSGEVLQSFISNMSKHYSIISPVKVLNSADFGVPQSRERLFIIGVRLDLNYKIEYPSATHIRPSDARYLFHPIYKNHASEEKSGELLYCPTVADAINDLPNPDLYSELIEGDTIENIIEGEYLSSYAQVMRKSIQLEDDQSTPRSDWQMNLITNTKRTKHDQRIIKEFMELKQGELHKSRRKRLEANGLSPTIRAGTKSDKGSYTALRPIHYKLPRVITVREAARLMSFPDWMIFHETKWHGFRLVGNAVPPLLARAVAKIIYDVIQKGTTTRKELVYEGT